MPKQEEPEFQREVPIQTIEEKILSEKDIVNIGQNLRIPKNIMEKIKKENKELTKRTEFFESQCKIMNIPILKTVKKEQKKEIEEEIEENKENIVEDEENEIEED